MWERFELNLSGMNDKRQKKATQKTLTSMFKTVGKDSSQQDNMTSEFCPTATKDKNSPSKQKLSRDKIQNVEEETKQLNSVEQPKVRDGKVWCWNVNGVRACLKDGSLVNFLNEVKPDVLCFNETKIDEIALEREGIK